MCSMLVAGCETTTGGGGKTNAAICTVLRPVDWSPQDTDETIRQNKANNAVGYEVCGWRPKKRPA